MLFIALPGPFHLGQSPVLAHRMGTRFSPQAAMLQTCDRIDWLLERGQAVTLVPPGPWPDPSLLAALGLEEIDASLFPLLAEQRDVDLQGLALLCAGSDTVDGMLRVLVANRAGSRAQSLFTQAATARLTAVFGGLPRCQVVPALPASPAFADNGAISYLTVHGDDSTQRFHCFGYAAALAMPSKLLPRQGRALSTREAHEAQIRRAAVIPGRSLMARLHWKALDDGSTGLADMATAHAGRLLAHELAFGEVAAVCGRLEELAPGLQARVLRTRDLPFAKALKGGFFRPLWLEGPASAGYRLAVEESLISGPCRRALDRLVDEGFVDGYEALPPAPELALPGPMAQFLRVGLDDEQRAALPPGLQASPHATAALREWALREAPERLGVDHLAEADVRARLAEAFAGLMQVLQLS